MKTKTLLAIALIAATSCMAQNPEAISLDNAALTKKIEALRKNDKISADPVLAVLSAWDKYPSVKTNEDSNWQGS